MPYTNITKPTAGDATRKSLADALIDNDAFFFSLLSALQSQFVPNGSFELDGNGDGIPDQWARTLYTGGSFTLDTAARHGIKSAKFTSAGGAGTGGGYLESADFFEVSPELSYELSWHFKSTPATVHNVIEIRWYDSAQTYVSSATLWDSQTANPTAWIAIDRQAIPPATARFAKIRLIGCKNDNTTAGSTWFDGVSVKEKRWFNRCDFLTPGEWRWVCPAGVNVALAEVFGAGGGGGNTNDAGGGGGGYARKVISTTPGTAYSVIVGAGGDTGNPGTTGQDSSFDGSIIAHGGEGANQLTPGAGGTASGGDVNETGGAGNGVANGYGGTSHPGGRNLNGAGGAPIAGPVIGSGGSGGGGAGGGGADGAVFISF